MSKPITACLIHRAARNEPGAVQSLKKLMEANKAAGAFSLWPCKHSPPCAEGTEEQLLALLAEVPDLTALL